MPYWTPDNIDLLTVLWSTQSATEIGRQLHVSRNAVVGKIYRLRAKGHVLKIEARTPAPRAVPDRKITIRPPPKPLRQRREPRNVAIRCPCQVTELGCNNCKWPIGDPREADFFFCGAFVPEGSKPPYCPVHARLAHRKEEKENHHDRARSPVPAEPVRAPDANAADAGFYRAASFVRALKRIASVRRGTTSAAAR